MQYLIIIFLTISLLFSIIYSIHINKELLITRKTREGYEKKFNTFKMKYNILTKLEDKDRVLENVKKVPQPIYLWRWSDRGQI